MSRLCSKCGTSLYYTEDDTIILCPVCVDRKEQKELIIKMSNNLQCLVDMYKFANNLKVNEVLQCQEK